MFLKESDDNFAVEYDCKVKDITLSVCCEIR